MKSARNFGRKAANVSRSDVEGQVRRLCSLVVSNSGLPRDPVTGHLYGLTLLSHGDIFPVRKAPPEARCFQDCLVSGLSSMLNKTAGFLLISFFPYQTD